MKKVIILSSIALVAVLTGCGGGSSSSDSSLNDGYFIDSPVKGLHYHTSSGLDGTTDKDGKFRYKDDDKVKFSIGKVILGEAKPKEDGLVTPKELSNGDREVENLLLRTLQSFDENSKPEDGIVIPKHITDELSKLPKEEHFSRFKKDEDLRGINRVFDNVANITETKAEEHFNSSMMTWRDKHKTVQQEHEETHQELFDKDKDNAKNEVEDIMDDMYKKRK
jgi:hypothetical protein